MMDDIEVLNYLKKNCFILQGSVIEVDEKAFFKLESRLRDENKRWVHYHAMYLKDNLPVEIEDLKKLLSQSRELLNDEGVE